MLLNHFFEFSLDASGVFAFPGGHVSQEVENDGLKSLAAIQRVLVSSQAGEHSLKVGDGSNEGSGKFFAVLFRPDEDYLLSD